MRKRIIIYGQNENKLRRCFNYLKAKYKDILFSIYSEIDLALETGDKYWLSNIISGEDNLDEQWLVLLLGKNSAEVIELCQPLVSDKIRLICIRQSESPEKLIKAMLDFETDLKIFPFGVDTGELTHWEYVHDFGTIGDITHL